MGVRGVEWKMSILWGWNLFWSFHGGLTLPLFIWGVHTPPPQTTLGRPVFDCVKCCNLLQCSLGRVLKTNIFFGLGHYLVTGLIRD